MPKITISLDSNEEKILRKRAKKNLFTIKEQIEDIVRRSCISKGASSTRKIKVDDTLVHVFSREMQGKKRKSKKKKK